MICAPVKEKDIIEVLAKIKKVPAKYDLIEVWIDEIDRIDEIDENGILEICHAAKRKPLVFKFTNKINFSLIAACLNKKIHYVDIDSSNDQTTVQRIKTIINDKKIILSHHDDSKTALFTDLFEKAQEMKQKGADIIKIVTKANNIADNIVPLRLNTNAQAIGIPIISFCSGRLGMMSRIYASKFGSHIDYVPPSEKYITAEGQVLYKKFKLISKYLF